MLVCNRTLNQPRLSSATDRERVDGSSRFVTTRLLHDVRVDNEPPRGIYALSLSSYHKSRQLASHVYICVVKKSHVPSFRITGYVNSTCCHINKAFDGHVRNGVRFFSRSTLVLANVMLRINAVGTQRVQSVDQVHRVAAEPRGNVQ